MSAGLPGKITSNAPAVVDGRAVWSPAVGERVEMTATADARRLTPLLYYVGGALVVAVGLLAAVLWRQASIAARAGVRNRVTPVYSLGNAVDGDPPPP